MPPLVLRVTVLKVSDVWVVSGDFDPSSLGYSDPPTGSFFLRQNGSLYAKTGVVNTDWTLIAGPSGSVAGADNVGTAGVGTFDSGTSTLHMRKIAPGSSQVTVTLNGQEIDIDINSANVTGVLQSGVVNLSSDLVAKANVASPSFTGTPIAPTAPLATNTTQIATTEFVQTAIDPKAPKDSPTFTGTPSGPTAALGTNTTQLATTAFVTNATGTLAPLSSPGLTGTPTAPTAAPGTNTTQLATTAFVTNAAGSGGTSDGDKVDITVSASGTIFTIDNSVVTYAKIQNVEALAVVGRSANSAGVSAGIAAAAGGQVLKSMTSEGITTIGFAPLVALVDGDAAPLDSPTFTGDPRSVTATPGNNTTAIATTAFVTAAVATGSGGVSSDSAFAWFMGVG